jgi:RNA-binding protein YhbY
MLLGLLLVFTNSSTVEAKSKLKKSTTVTVKTLNKSTVKKVDKAFQSAKVVKVKVKASSKKKAEKTMTKLSVKLCEYTGTYVTINDYKSKKQGSYYVFENKASVTKAYRGSNEIYLACNKVDTKSVQKVHNTLIEQAEKNSGKDITVAIKAKNEKEGLKKFKALCAEVGKYNTYGFLPVTSYIVDYDKGTGYCYCYITGTNAKDYYYGMKLVQEMVDIRRAKWQEQIDSGELTAEKVAELQQRMTMNFCDFSSSMKLWMLSGLFGSHGPYCHYDYVQRKDTLGKEVSEESRANAQEKYYSKQTDNDFENMYNRVWTGICGDFNNVEQKLLFYLGWSNEDVVTWGTTSGVTGNSHVAPFVKVTNSKGQVAWVYHNYGNFTPYANTTDEYALQDFTAW